MEKSKCKRTLRKQFAEKTGESSLELIPIRYAIGRKKRGVNNEELRISSTNFTNYQ